MINRVLNAIGTRQVNLRSIFSCFCFGAETFKSLGIVFFPFATKRDIKTITVDLEIVQADFTALIYMDSLDRENIVTDTVLIRLARRRPTEDKNVDEYT